MAAISIPTLETGIRLIEYTPEPSKFVAIYYKHNALDHLLHCDIYFNGSKLSRETWQLIRQELGAFKETTSNDNVQVQPSPKS